MATDTNTPDLDEITATLLHDIVEAIDFSKPAIQQGQKVYDARIKAKASIEAYIAANFVPKPTQEPNQ